MFPRSLLLFLFSVIHDQKRILNILKGRVSASNSSQRCWPMLHIHWILEPKATYKPTLTAAAFSAILNRVCDSDPVQTHEPLFGQVLAATTQIRVWKEGGGGSDLPSLKRFKLRSRRTPYPTRCLNTLDDVACDENAETVNF